MGFTPFFLKLPFFCSVLLLLTPEHFLINFSGKLTTKNGQKTSQRRKFFFLFFIISFTFSLSRYGKKQNHLLFSPFLSPEIGKREGKMSFKKKYFFFFFFLTFFHPTAPRNLKNYHLLFFFEIPT